MEQALRGQQPPVIGRLHEKRLLLDLRTVPEEDDRRLLRALRRVLKR